MTPRVRRLQCRGAPELVAALAGRRGRRRRGALARRPRRPAGCTARSTKTVVVRAAGPGGGAAARRSSPRKPLARQRLPAGPDLPRRARAGVVTIISYFGRASEARARGRARGFVVSADGTILTSAHVITTAGQGANAHDRAGAQVYVEFADGDRVRGADRRLRPLRRRRRAPGRPGSPRARARCRSATRAASSSASRWPRSAARSATSTRSRSASSRPIRRSIPSLTTALQPRRRDPDRRADQPRQLRRPALRRARPRDRHQRPDPLQRHRARASRASASPSRSTRPAARWSSCCSTGKVELRLRRDHDRGPDAGDRAASSATPRRQRRADRRRQPGQRRPPRRACAAGTRDVVYQGLDVKVGGDAIVAIDGDARARSAEDVVRIVAPAAAARRDGAVHGRPRRRTAASSGHASPSARRVRNRAHRGVSAV